MSRFIRFLKTSFAGALLSRLALLYSVLTAWIAKSKHFVSENKGFITDQVALRIGAIITLRLTAYL